MSAEPDHSRSKPKVNLAKYEKRSKYTRNILLTFSAVTHLALNRRTYVPFDLLSQLGKYLHFLGRRDSNCYSQEKEEAQLSNVRLIFNLTHGSAC